MNYERFADSTHETRSPYEHVNSTDLIDTYYESQGNPAIGVELSLRLFHHAGFQHDPAQVPLVSSAGQQIYNDNQPLSLADYVNFAAQNHFGALDGILSFLEMDPDEPDYQAMVHVITGRLNPGS